jgi:hypothetical protein
MLTRISALFSADGVSLRDDFHHIRFQRWSDARNDSVQVAERFIPRGDPIPWEVELDGLMFRQGQCSGTAMSVVWFDLIEDFS